TSKKRVPVGIDIKNEEYWVVTGNYNAQIEEYRKEVRDMQEEIDLKANKDYVINEMVKVNDDLKDMQEEIDLKANKDYVINEMVNVKDDLKDGLEQTIK